MTNRDEIYKMVTFTHVNHDLNGNHRIVVPFLVFFTEDEIEQSQKENGLNHIEKSYKIACKLANKIGGRKFHNKQYGGGIVFQAYSCEEVYNLIQSI